ncbi:MAG TPA: PQQ-dependent dehydrogenase, methanol/ethanol family [Steroidobacteraceae bacterium]|nr:PQQ-dependent dehydrogenase, methanol/ethanol family [Steroidobacteraceae bacterium]
MIEAAYRTTRHSPRALAALSAALTGVLILSACGAHSPAPPVAAPASSSGPPPGQIDLERLQSIDKEPGAWLTTGRDLGKTHYSPLDAINRDSAARLGFAWQFKTGTNRGMEATPIVVDGVMYTSGVAGRVYALDAATGALRWQFAPPLKLKNARGSCCDIVNRGVAVWRGRVYVGSFEGVLYALDAKDGSIRWQTDTFVDHARAYSITGAPQIAGNLVVIGNGGAEFDSRGYVSAYELDTGKLVWRFYTVPGDPAKPYENPALRIAARTWDPKHAWMRGGGGNAWDAFAYDPKRNLVYFGTANGAPWNTNYRSPDGGDNLFIASIIALNASTGKYVWHYQETPNDRWDYDATPHLMLATLKIGGTDRDVLLQASKNGIFYVLDRGTGELLAADKFVDENWATRVDLKTGRPIESPDADYTRGKPVIVFPSGVGGHNFNPMSLSARTGLVYIPTVHSGMGLLQAPPTPYLPERMASGVQVAFATQLLAPAATLPPGMRPVLNPNYLKRVPSLDMHATLKAWNPITHQVVWEHRYASFMDHGGVLSTGGGIVIQGSIDGKLRVFNDETGALIKELDTGSPLIAAPMTYAVNGRQYVAILAGSGGGGWNIWMPGNIAAERGNDNRILAFRLDGGATPIPPMLPAVPPLPAPPPQTGTPADRAAGATLFGRNCAGCHANVDRSPVPDLRRSGFIRDAAAFQSVVRGGALQTQGMPSWDDLLTAAEVEQIRVHLIGVARDAYAKQQAGNSTKPPPDLKEGHL